MSAHSLFSASGFAAQVACPGRTRAIQYMRDKGLLVQDQSSPASREGTAAHAVLESYLNDFEIPETVEVEGEIIEVTQQMRDSAVYLAAWISDTYPNAKVHAESRVHYGREIAQPDADAWGTSDVIVHAPDRLAIIDLKYGQGIRVSPEGNMQMQLYALGALRSARPEVDTIDMVIYQPRIEPEPQVYTVTRADLMKFATEASVKARRVREAGTEFNAFTKSWARQYLRPSETACRWCPVSGSCPSYANSVFELLDATPIDAVPGTPAERLVAHYSKTRYIRDWCAAVESEVKRRMLEQGESLPGLMVAPGRKGARYWADEAAARKALDDLIAQKRTTPDDVYVNAPKSPVQLEKVLPREAYKELTAFVAQKDGAPTVKWGDPNEVPAHVLEAFETLGD